ncbi:MAG: PH domain-containing protein [Anaerolinea sp.]|nr:PH domain-containing protein [Anaerolinea sp.]
MGYIENNLVPGERIVYRTRLHWFLVLDMMLRILFFIAVIWILASSLMQSNRVSPANTVVVDIYSIFASLLGLLLCSLIPFSLMAFVLGLIVFLTAEFGLTTRRIMIKTGIIRRKTLELSLGKVESFQMHESIIGRLLGFNTLRITGSGGTAQTFKYVANAREFQRHVTEFSTQVNERYDGYSPQPVRTAFSSSPSSIFDNIPLPDTDTEARIRQAASAIQRGNRDQAKQIVQALIKSSPDNADVWYLAGYLAQSPDRKRQAFERALRINPSHQKARLELRKL